MFKCKLIQLMATSLHVLETMIFFFLELLQQKIIPNNITHGITETTVTLLSAPNFFFLDYVNE